MSTLIKINYLLTLVCFLSAMTPFYFLRKKKLAEFYLSAFLSAVTAIFTLVWFYRQLH